MRKTRDLFKKLRDTKEILPAKMGKIKNRNGMDLTKSEDIRRGGGGERNGNSLQYSCLENSMDRGVWRAEDHGITKLSMCA